MKVRFLAVLVLFATGRATAHDLSLAGGHSHVDCGLNAPAFFSQKGAPLGSRAARTNRWPVQQRSGWSRLAARLLLEPLMFTSVLSGGGANLYAPPAGNGLLMAASFGAFKPKVRYYWDATTFYEESDNMPDGMPNKMVGITSWQQQIPVPVAYFANTTNPENNTASLGYGQPNYWRLPLMPTAAASPTTIFTPGSTSNNFQRGAIALASNGVAIFNPANNTGRVSYEIGELDAYGGHCGLADDYHYHIIPMHLYARYGGPLTDDRPVAWALDGYPIYGYVEPDGSPRLALDASGGHDIGNGWGYHYHAVGTNTVDASHPYGSPQSPYTMTAFRGVVVNFGGQVDGQPEVGSIRASGTGGYTAQPVAGASIVAFKNPAALTTDGSGHLVESVGGATSPDAFLMRVSISGTTYDECWKINRSVNPRTLTVTWRLPGATTTTTYTPNAGTAAGNRLAAYTMSGPSQANTPDTSQTTDATATFGEDSDYSIHPQSFTDHGDGTVTDNVTGLMWQKTDSGENTWENAVANAPGVTTGGYSDWRLPTPSELFSLFNHGSANPALNTSFFPNNPSGAADYWWTSDVYGTSTTNVWCANAGGGLGPKPKSETISAGGAFRYHARYVRGAKPTNGHNYQNNGDGTVTDTDTGLMWTQIPAAAMTWEAALSYAEDLTLGGFGDWRLPNVKELQTLTDYTLATATNTAGLKPSLNRTMFAKMLTNCTTTAGGTIITCDDTTGLLPGMPLVDPSHVAGTYIPNSTPPTVASILDANSFTLSGGTGIAAGSGFALKALAPPTAFWSSTSQNNNTANAWVVEFGVNTGASPQRNAQGIISYNAKTANYPVFAVRTTSVATQIVVEQPSGAALNDGVSTVGFGNVSVGSTATKTFAIRNSGSTTLMITGVTIDGSGAAYFSIIGPPTSSLAPGEGTTMDVRFDASVAGARFATLHIASTDTAAGAAFDIALTGSGYIPPPTITNTRRSLNTPTYVDKVWITAQISASSGASITSAQLAWSDGAQVTSTAFEETMSSTPTSGTGGWDGSGAVYPWTITSTAGAGNIKQSTAANYGSGGTCGLEMGKGSSSATATMAETTNPIDASGTVGYIEFWNATSNLSAGLGWTFQLSTDGTTWNTRLTETSGTNHAHQLYHYDLLASERVSTLRIRFQFIGNGTGGPTGPKAYFDDITVVRATGNPPTMVDMYDDGLHGDGAAGDGAYGGEIRVQTAGTTVMYSITVADSNGSITTSPASGSYTVSPVTPPASFAAAILRSGSSVTVTWPAQAGISYSVQWSDDLVHWADVPVGPTGTWTDATVGTATRRFYRVSR